MVVSHRESTISSNIRAIIEQLNLNPVERRRLIESRANEVDRIKFKQHRRDDDHQREIGNNNVTSKPIVTIGVYGLKRNTSNENDKKITIINAKRTIEQKQQQILMQKIRNEDKILVVKKIEPRIRQRVPTSLEISQVLEVKYL